MKKHLFLLVFAFATAAMHAQNNETFSLMYQDMGEYQFNIQNFMRQRDGDFVICTFVGIDSWSPPYQGPTSVGNIFYKISPSTLAITDSLLVEDPNAPYYLFAPNPSGEGNIRANFEYHEDCDSTFLRICHFPDNNLLINHDEDILTPVCEGDAFLCRNNIVDCDGDLIVTYGKERPAMFYYDIYMARFDPDGTLKHQALVLENEWRGLSPIRMLKESPRKYYQWSNDDSYPSNLDIFVFDSLFNTNTIIINSVLSQENINPYQTTYEYLYIDLETEVIPVGGDDILVAAKYVYDTNFHGTAEYGVVVAKYDMRTMHQKSYIVFNDFPGGYYYQEKCLGLKMMSDGTVYLLYKENGYPEESINVVKMDTDLNVEWKRFCKTDNLVMDYLRYPNLFEDEQEEKKGIAWIGSGTETESGKAGLIYLFLNHDGTVGMSEGGIEVRPYAFYPNPVKEQLLMDFSPDVQPAQVELYDLQGRLVRTQDKTFESINMSQLPAGTYTMRVTLKDGKAYTNKVVKE